MDMALAADCDACAKASAWPRTGHYRAACLECGAEYWSRIEPTLPDGWRAVAVSFDPGGDDPRADAVTDAWLDAMNAFYAAVPEHQHGFAEWCGRLRAAMTVLADRLPPTDV